MDSIKITNPQMAQEWNYKRNTRVDINDVTNRSGKLVWWRCANGHEWRARVIDRARGTKCPFCAGRRAIIGKTDLKTTNPELAAEWDFEKNTEFDIAAMTNRSTKKVWWRCQSGHEWQARIMDRVAGTGCPYCAGRKAILGETDLRTTHPEIASEWDTEKNPDIDITKVTARSSKMASWKCEAGHTWQARIVNRANGTHACPYCSAHPRHQRRLLPGFNDLAHRNPELASEWHPSKNGTLTPAQIAVNSGKKVWWQGRCGHEWQARVANRNHGSGCPYCYKIRHGEHYESKNDSGRH